MRLSRRELGAGALGGVAASWLGEPAHAQPGHGDCPAGLWRTLPPTPALPVPRETGHVRAAGAASLWFADFGPTDAAGGVPAADPILLLHGGLANSDYWGAVLPKLAARRRVLVLDTRGHGRSTMGDGSLSYALLAEDAATLLDRRGIARAAIVGWSDGGIAGLQLAMTEPDRVGGLFTFGANFSRAGLVPGGARAAAFQVFERRCTVEYARLSPQPGGFGALRESLRRMWASEPAYRPADLARIRAATTVCDGAHDELILQAHTAALAAAIPNARLVIQPCVSHFGLLQDPARFGQDVLAGV